MAPTRRSVTTAAAGLLAATWLGGGLGGGLGGCTGSDPAAVRSVAPALRGRRVIAVSAGPRRSVYLGWTTALAEQLSLDHPNLTVDVRVSSGSIENLRRLRNAT